MNQIYLAARYSRRVELCAYREQLRALGYIVPARWLNGTHQLDNVGVPIGDSGEQLIESTDPRVDGLRSRFAMDDWEDVHSADTVISFTEAPRTTWESALRLMAASAPQGELKP